MPSPPSITNLPAFLAFVERQGSQRASLTPGSVVNEPRTVATGWLYRDRRDSIELHRERLGYHDTSHYTPEEKELLKALCDVIDVGEAWAGTDVQAGDMSAMHAAMGVAAESDVRMPPPLLAKIYKACRQGTLCRSHLPVMGQPGGRITRGGVSKIPGGSSPPPSGT